MAEPIRVYREYVFDAHAFGRARSGEPVSVRVELCIDKDATAETPMAVTLGMNNLLCEDGPIMIMLDCRADDLRLLRDVLIAVIADAEAAGALPTAYTALDQEHAAGRRP